MYENEVEIIKSEMKGYVSGAAGSILNGAWVLQKMHSKGFFEFSCK